MNHSDDTSRGLPPPRLRGNLALKLITLSALVALLIIGHWAYLYVFGTSARRISCVPFLIEALVLLTAIGTVVFGGGAMLLDHVLVRLGLSTERRQNLWSALAGAFFLFNMFRHVARDDHSSSDIFFTLGAAPVTERDMAFFAMGVFLFATMINCLAAFGLLEFGRRRQG